MRRQEQGQMVRWVSRSAAMAAGVAALFATGCARNRQESGLLGPRSVVPAPYVEPAASSPSTAIPAEPAFTPTTVVPAGGAVDEGPAMLPAEVEDTKPPKGSSSKPGAPALADGERLTYTVKKGDSLWLIAQMYGVSVAELAAENDLQESKVLRIGQTVTLPRGARLRDASEIKRTTTKRAATASSSKPKSTVGAKPATGSAKAAAPGATRSTRKTTAKEPLPADGMYTIKSGDNPWDLARKFGVKHEELMQWNNLKSDTVLQVGQKIRLRAGAAEGAALTTTPAVPTTVPPEVVAPAPGTVLRETTPLTAPAGVGTAPGTETPVPAPGTTVPAAGTPAAAAGTAADTVAPGTATPANPPGALDLPKKLSHSVTEGETLQVIAEMYGTTVDAIKKENPTVKTDADLQPNLKLMVPYR